MGMGTGMGGQGDGETAGATAGDASTEEIADDLRDARPRLDSVAMEDVRARAERVLFGTSAPARLGRFLMLGPIAGGGMGVVYSAYDPQLDRRVALKLLHPQQRGTDRARARLIGEARALARLDHPNVVPIHDVLELDDQIVLVMELVAGRTLAAWEREGARSWRELVARYAEAGRGLAAAHRLGLAHRDFKPANVIVGDDGRVRVLDFGLARLDGADEERAPTLPSGAEREPAPPLTVTGEVLGTVGFMAPEQLRGEAATAASDQFSFCVALHRALHERPPFAGATVAELLTSIEAGRIDPGAGTARAPGWLRAVIARGLATEPGARFPSMQHLLAELERERGWRRWRWPAVAGGAVVAAALSIVVAARAPAAADAEAACDGGAREIAETWSEARRARLGAALAAADPDYYARAGGDRLLDTLDEYRAAWSQQHRDACSEHRRGAQAAPVHERRMRCLARRRVGLGAAARVLEEVDRAALPRAADVVVGLSPVADCGDLELLAQEREPPPTLAARVRAAELSRRLAYAELLGRVGRAGEAVAEAAAVAAAARALPYAPLVVEALLAEGQVRLERDPIEPALAPLAEAERLALAERMYRHAVIAGARRLYAQGRASGASDFVLGEAAGLEALSQGLLHDRFARPLLLNNIGTLHLARGDRDRARASFAAARQLLDGGSPPDLELAVIDQNLALVTREPAAREALARGVWIRTRDELGPAHLRTLAIQFAYARYLASAAEALPLITEVCRVYREVYPDERASLAECLYSQALLAAETGDEPQATALYRELAALPDPSSGPLSEDAASWRDLAAGHAALRRGDPAGALARFEAVRAAFADRPGWWNRQRAGHALLGEGLAARALGRAADALAHLDQAAVVFAAITGVNEDVENHRCLALARRTAAALRAAPPPVP